MTPEMFIKMFTYNYYCLKKNIEGITHEESLFQPRPGGNCLNWIVGHILATRNFIFFCLDEEPLWGEEQAQRYKRGSKPIASAEEAVPWDTLMADLERSQQQLIKALGKRTPQDFQKTEAGDDESMAEKLIGLHFHEAYHTGQTGILRRLLGKQGAIR